MIPLGDLPDVLRARPLTTSDEDVDAVTALIAACETDLDGVTEIDRDDVVVEFGRPGFDTTSDTVAVFEKDELVGWAQVFKERAEADVHPRWRGNGIGRSLLAWTEARAAKAGTALVRQVITDANEAAASLFKANGYVYGHTSWILRIDFDRLPDEPGLPDGITIRPYDAAYETAVYTVVEEAFGEWPGRPPTSFEDWRAMMVDHGSFAPSLSRLAFEGDRLVGVALAIDYRNDDHGWIHQVATDASRRHRGIARALLTSVFRAFYERGNSSVELNTDSRTGALGLYERVGMHVHRSYTSYSKALKG